MKHIILVNPVSGNKSGIKYGIRIQKLLAKNKIDSEIIISKYSGHIIEVAKELSSKENCRFYSVGGDGTLNEVVSGIINSDSDIVVIPCGTGNDYVKSISKYMSMRKIVLESINKESSYVDVMQYSKNKYCINILNMGFDALIGKNVDIFRNVPFISGSMKYNLSILYSLLSGKNYKFKINDIKGHNILKGRFTLAAVANGKYYGGGICPCPTAIVDDGKLDICAIDSTTLMQRIKFLSKYKKGKHIHLKPVHIYQTNEISIVSTSSFPVSVDGEIIYSNKLHIILLSNAVKIVKI